LITEVKEVEKKASETEQKGITIEKKWQRIKEIVKRWSRRR